jgi:hypothetical protein
MGNEGTPKPPQKQETVIQEPTPQNPEKFLEGVKRPFGIEDIKNFQQVFRTFEKRRSADKAEYVFGDNEFYEFLVNHRNGAPERVDPNEVPVKGYEDVELKLFTRWREYILHNKEGILRGTSDKWKTVLRVLEEEPAPTTLQEVRALYIKHPEVDTYSAVHYQSGVGQGSGFVHLNLERAGFAREKEGGEEMRVYLNPPYKAIPELSKLLMNRSIQEEVPLYFKTIDFSDVISRDNVSRLDRLVICTSKDNIPKLVRIIEDIRTVHPEWFEGRELPNMVANIGNGIGIAAEPTEYQNEKFSRMGEKRTSFNSVRAKFLQAVWKTVIRNALTKNAQLRPRDGRTLRQIFDDTFSQTAIRYKKDVDMAGLKTHLDELWAAKLNLNYVSSTNKRILETTLMRVLADVLPYTTPESIIPFVQQAIQEHADEFGIDPDNLALNKEPSHATK